MPHREGEIGTRHVQSTLEKVAKETGIDCQRLIEEFNERAAILEFSANFSRVEAEQRALNQVEALARGGQISK